MGSNADLAKHVAWELQESPMEGNESDCASRSGPRSVVPKNSDEELAPEEYEKHVSTGDISVFEDTPHAE